MLIKIERNPYGVGTTPTRPTKIDIHPGLTILVGCNGAGKTTLINNIKSEMRSNNIPVHLFDNLRDGGHNSYASILCGFGEFESDDMSVGVSLFSSSEGEAIRINLKRQESIYKKFLETGDIENRTNKIARIFRNKESDSFDTNIRVLLFDATDSGVSIDSICEIKNRFRVILEYAESIGIDLYIVISANEYELCRNENCFDVNSGKYIRFNDYEQYRDFILKSRERKEKRIEKQIEFAKREAMKEKISFEKKKAKLKNQIDAINNKAIAENRELTAAEKYRINSKEREIKDELNKCIFYSEH